jgi:hypothetical protein
MSIYVDKKRGKKREREKELSQDTHLFSAKADLGCWNTLGEAVCNHFTSGNEVRVEHAMFHFVPEPVETKIQMFHPSMMFRMLK